MFDSFNKSHACAYGKTSAICCYLLANYPTEYYSACLTLELTQSEPNITGIIKEAKTFGINFLPANINESDYNFKCTKEGIMFPLNSVKFVGEKQTNAIIENRPYKDLTDLLTRVPKSIINKRTGTNLIKAGSMDCFEPNRSYLLQKFYDMRGIKDNVFFYCDEVQMQYENQAYGFTISKHPMSGYSTKTIQECNGTMLGRVIGYRQFKDKKGRDMAIAKLDNDKCEFEVVIFFNKLKKFQHLFKEGNKLQVWGNTDGGSVLLTDAEML